MLNLKEILSKKTNIINCLSTNYIDNLSLGNNDLVFNEITLKLFYIPSNIRKIVVFLSALGSNRDQYPIFNRISWYKSFDGIKLYFDDPTRHMFDCAPGFYFGTEASNCLDIIKNLITELQKKFMIENHQITFISSSNGGFGVLSLSNDFLGSKCIALCPQFNIKLFFGKNYKNFQKKIGYNEKLIEKKRLELSHLLNNNDSRIIVQSNISSLIDRVQIDYFCRLFNYKYKLGLNRVKPNIYLIITQIDYIEPHMVQLDEVFCKYLNNFFWDDDDRRRTEEVNTIIDSMTRAYQYISRFHILNNFFSVVPFNNNFKFISNDGHFFTLYLTKDVYSVLPKSGNILTPNLRIYYSNLNIDLDYIKKLISQKKSLKLDISDRLVNIYSSEISFNDFHNWLENLLTDLNISL